MTGTIFDIQHYSVHDGPGIRTLVFLKGCPLRCLWCCNPESQGAGPEIEHLAPRCRACLRCLGACPEGAISAEGGGIRIDRAACSRCGKTACLGACPEGALRLVGREVEAPWVVNRIAADLDFYRNSGGGVTFSGGEPFAQAGFLLDLLERCKALGIHTAVETCGFGSPSDFREAEPLVDLFLFDLKILDGARHEKATGHGNGLILENLRFLSERAPEKLIVRVPVIPGLTDDRANLLAIAALASGLGLRTVDLQPYHALGMDKYEALGRRPWAPESPDSPPPLSMPEKISIFRALGLACEVCGI